MKTRLLIMLPDGTSEIRDVELPRQPGYCRLNELLTPLLDGADLEHVSVLADFDGGTNFVRSDMFVNEIGVLEGLPLNSAATEIYRRAAMLRAPSREPETLPSICGPAILFDRQVWF